jgi:hypothetical protein
MVSHSHGFLQTAHISRKTGEKMWQLTESICTKSDLAGQIVQTLMVTTLHQVRKSRLFSYVENLCFHFHVQCSSTAYTGSSELQLPSTPADIMVVSS